jgi:PIN domain nuclease of toxin-antitoxin system
VTLLDAYAMIAFLTGGPALEAVTEALRGGGAALCAVNLAETCDVAARRRGIPAERVLEALEPLLDGVLKVLPLELTTAARAGALRARHYDRATCAISLADAVLLASACETDRIATSDQALLSVAATLGIATLPLPPSR